MGSPAEKPLTLNRAEGAERERRGCSDVNQLFPSVLGKIFI